MQPPSLRHSEGRNVHIGLLMDTSVYVIVATTGCTRPTNPGPYTKHGPGNIAAEQADDNAIYKEERRTYDLDENVDATLK